MLGCDPPVSQKHNLRSQIKGISKLMFSTHFLVFSKVLLIVARLMNFWENNRELLKGKRKI